MLPFARKLGYVLLFFSNNLAKACLFPTKEMQIVSTLYV